MRRKLWLGKVCDFWALKILLRRHWHWGWGRGTPRLGQKCTPPHQNLKIFFCLLFQSDRNPTRKRQGLCRYYAVQYLIIVWLQNCRQFEKISTKSIRKLNACPSAKSKIFERRRTTSALRMLTDFIRMRLWSPFPRLGTRFIIIVRKFRFHICRNNSACSYLLLDSFSSGNFGRIVQAKFYGTNPNSIANVAAGAARLRRHRDRANWNRKNVGIFAANFHSHR